MSTTPTPLIDPAQIATILAQRQGQPQPTDTPYSNALRDEQAQLAPLFQAASAQALGIPQSSGNGPIDASKHPHIAAVIQAIRGGLASFGEASQNPTLALERERLGISRQDIAARLAESIAGQQTNSMYRAAMLGQGQERLGIQAGRLGASEQQNLVSDLLKSAGLNNQMVRWMQTAKPGAVVEDSNSPSGFSKVLVGPDGKEMGRIHAVAPPAGMLPTEREGYQTIQDQITGDLIQVPTRSVTHKVLPGVGALPTSPSPAGNAPLSSPPASPSQPRVVGHVTGKAFGNESVKDVATARDADFRWRQMNDSLPKALGGDQQAQTNILANHIGMTLGLQKGARITQAFWQEAQKSSPWLARVGARFDSRGYLSGVVLTKDQISQMMSLAGDSRKNAWTRARESARQAGIEDRIQFPSDLGGVSNNPGAGQAPTKIRTADDLLNKYGVK